jgi:MFS family permease
MPVILTPPLNPSLRSNTNTTISSGSALGRYSAGHLSDTLGRFNTLLIKTLFAVLIIFTTWLPIPVIPSDSVASRLGLLYTFAILFGFGSGSIISLAPVCFGQLCKVEDYGRYYGTAYSVVSFA